METIQFDEIDRALLHEHMVARDLIDGPCLGDFVRFPTGEIERLSANHGKTGQTSPIWAGSFYLHTHGDASFSGSLNPLIQMESLTRTNESMEGEFWFFHHGQAGAGRGVRFKIPCSVYATSAEYQGYITPGIT